MYSYSLNLLHVRKCTIHAHEDLVKYCVRKRSESEFLIGLYFGTNCIEKNPAA